MIYSVQDRIITLPESGLQVVARGMGAVVEPWWLSGGIAAGNCVAAYQPKGTASLAASYVNLANPGTYDAYPGVAPTWDAVNGWIFSGAQYLRTGITPAGDQTWSCVARYSNITVKNYAPLLGANNATAYFGLEPYRPDNLRLYYHGTTYVLIGTIASSGVMAMAGRQGYFNGVAEGGLIPPSAVTFAELYIAYWVSYYLKGNIQSASVYNTTLSAPQILSVTNAMNAL